MMNSFFVICFLLCISFKHGESENLSRTYNTRARPITKKLNVHLVAHTHDDLGWVQTPDEYYIGPDVTRANSIQTNAVQFILRSVIQELEDDPNRKFSYVETGFFARWWRAQNPAKQAGVRRLVADGQLEFLNGGWCMHDEATAHYIDMIDQTTLGHRFLKRHLGVVPRQGWQIDSFGHSAVQAYLLGAEAGFQAVFAARIDFREKERRRAGRNLEMVWRGSETLGSSADVFLSLLPFHYTPPATFNFEPDGPGCVPVQDDPLLQGYNADRRVDDLVRAAEEQAAMARTNHVLWAMGDDFAYQTAGAWFSAMDRLVHHANLDGRVNVLYSTPSIYLEAVHRFQDQVPSSDWPLKTGDFFPYADEPESYWTGYFTSRAAFKGSVRALGGYLQAARQLELFKGRTANGFSTDSLEEAMATVHHHDAVAGTSTQAVTDDHAKRLYIGAEESGKVINSALEVLTGGMRSKKNRPIFEQCWLLNISYCPASELASDSEQISPESLVMVAYNALAWPRVEYVRIPVSGTNLTVKDGKGGPVVAQIVPISDITRAVRDLYVQVHAGLEPSAGPLFHLVFRVSVPPLGFATFIIRRSSSPSGAAVLSTSDGMADSAAAEIGNGDLGLTFSSATGHLAGTLNRRTGIAVSVKQTNLWYKSFDGTSNPDDSQSSGAYIFRPDSSKARPVTSGARTDVISNSTVFRGPLVEEMWQEFSPWVSQVMRVYQSQDHVEVEFTIGPVPIQDNVGKEIITRFSTGIASGDAFYTDSNGRDFMRRVRHPRDDQPIAGNYYPANLGIYITDGETDFSALVDRAVGAASAAEGEVELMLHRRLVTDDDRGVGEPLNERVCLGDGDMGGDYEDESSSCVGLTVRGRYFFAAKARADAAEWRRTHGQTILSPLVLAFATAAPGESWEASHVCEFSAMAPNSSLPSNVALLTLQELDTGEALVRLAHLFQAGEHPTHSALAVVDLEDLFRGSGRRIVGATEMSLTANQERVDVQKLDWRVEGKDRPFSPIRGAPFDSSHLRVELGPMEIRTFLVSLDSEIVT